MLVGLGWWPPHIEFDEPDLATVIAVLKDRERRR